MFGIRLEELHSNLAKFRIEAQKIREKIDEIMIQADENEKAEETKRVLEREYSMALFKCAITEGIIAREEEERK